ncbi:hypothetical protein ACTRXD_11850 [Nitrospira sp. T9]|uniref:hypothetical protein n=1 Tax=unclassified Nitrospira TaxID=2652172 RepID=UPI003F99EBD9
MLVIPDPDRSLAAATEREAHGKGCRGGKFKVAAAHLVREEEGNFRGDKYKQSGVSGDRRIKEYKNMKH